MAATRGGRFPRGGNKLLETSLSRRLDVRAFRRTAGNLLATPATSGTRVWRVGGAQTFQVGGENAISAALS